MAKIPGSWRYAILVIAFFLAGLALAVEEKLDRRRETRAAVRREMALAGASVGEPRFEDVAQNEQIPVPPPRGAQQQEGGANHKTPEGSGGDARRPQRRLDRGEQQSAGGEERAGADGEAAGDDAVVGEEQLLAGEGPAEEGGPGGAEGGQ